MVFSTNVLVSAGINRTGAPAKLIMDWVVEGKMQLPTSPWVVKEYRAVVRREKFFRYGFPPPWLNLDRGKPLLARSDRGPSQFPTLRTPSFLRLPTHAGLGW